MRKIKNWLWPRMTLAVTFNKVDTWNLIKINLINSKGKTVRTETYKPPHTMRTVEFNKLRKGIYRVEMVEVLFAYTISVNN